MFLFCIQEEGTLTRYADFNLDSDCQELYNLLSSSNSDDNHLIQILCNRSIGQRLQIRDRYRALFKQVDCRILSKQENILNHLDSWR